MFERTSNTFLVDGEQKDCYGQQAADIGTEDPANRRFRYYRRAKDFTNYSIVDGHAMTRKTRTRRPRIQSLQSGYCEICHIPYNSLEDHIQSKRHQKLIGEDAGYIAINGFLNQDVDSFLNLNIDTLDNDISPRPKRKNMPRTRAASVVGDRIKPSPLSPANSEIIGHHHLRSRRNINYMTPPLDEDSLPESEKPDFSSPSRLSPTPSELPSREGLRSSARVLSRLNENSEKWNSGRPKRSCIRPRRNSTDERILSENPRAYYKVEVLSKTQSHELEPSRNSTQKNDDDDQDKGLIVKFKMVRNSELIRLNSEATNFLFPSKKDDTTDDEDHEEGDPDEDGANTTASTGRRDSTLLMSSEDDEMGTPQNFKIEDEGSMDSVGSDRGKKKKRRTHAEAFIMDNHKYYKFVMPGSRLRYQGSFLPSPNDTLKSPKSNGDCMTKIEKEEKPVVDEKKNFKLKLDDYKFSFETVPKNEQWYNTFRRQDTGETKSRFFNDFYWDSFVMPYQMETIPPLDPKKCIHQFNQIKKLLLDPPSSCTSEGCVTPDPSASSSSSSKLPDVQDEDSKNSMATSVGSIEDLKPDEPAPKRKKPIKPIFSPSMTKNPRKSPRQHASTLAILSSLLQQRKRKSKSLEDVSKPTLPVIPEETNKRRTVSPSPPPPAPTESSLQPPPPTEETKPPEEKPKEKPPRSRGKIIVCSRKPRAYHRKKPVAKVDYSVIAAKMEDEINSTLELEDNFEEIEQPEDSIDFKKSMVNISDILKLYDEGVKKEDEKTTRRFFNGSPGRKPGRRKKKNKTGWPNNRIRRLFKKEPAVVEKPEREENSTNETCSAHNSAVDEEMKSTDSIKINEKDEGANSDQVDRISDVNSVVEENCDLNSDRVDQQSEKILTVKLTNNSEFFQPYVCVQKLNSEKLVKNNKVNMSPAKRTSSRRQRRMPGSPKSPRMLRKPRGRWYRER